MEAIIISIVSLIGVVIGFFVNRKLTKSQSYKSNEEGNNLAIKTANELIEQMREMVLEYKSENESLKHSLEKLSKENEELKEIVNELRKEIDELKCKMN